MNKLRLPLLALVLVLLAAACGGGDTTGTTSPDDSTSSDDPTTAPSDPSTTAGDGETGTGDDVILSITEGGGFVPVEFTVNNGPRYLLTADGTLYFQGPIPEIFPGPLLPNYQVVDVSDQMDVLMDLIENTGLPTITDPVHIEGAANVADAPTTFATYHDENGAHVLSVYALGFELSPSDPQVLALLDLTMTLDSYAAEGPSVEYVPEQWQVLLADPVQEEGVAADVKPWPLPATPADFDTEIAGFQCLVVDNDPEMHEAFRNANQNTSWTSEGGDYRLLVRPLLPGEEGCVQPA